MEEHNRSKHLATMLRTKVHREKKRESKKETKRVMIKGESIKRSECL